VLRCICENEPHPLRSINPEVPAALETLIARLHAKSPDGRFSSAAEVRDLLADYLTHLQQPLTAPLPAALHRSHGDASAAGRRAAWIAIAVAMALLITVALWQSLHEGDGAPSGNDRRLNAQRAAVSSPAALPAGLLPLEEVDRQMREIGAAIGGLEQIQVDTGAASVGSARLFDDELSTIESGVQRLEAAGF
jgi:hypothetical protein